MTQEEARQGYPVRLRAVVTYYDAYLDTRHPALFIADRTGSVFVALAETPRVALRAGQMLEITGVSAPGDYAPIVGRASARVVAESHLPSSPPRVSLLEVQSGAEEGQWVEIEAIVQSVRLLGRNVFLDLALKDGPMTALTVAEPGQHYERLVDSRIRLRGNVAPLFNHHGQLTGAHLLFPDLSVLTVEQGSVSDPYSLPIRKVSDLLLYKPGEDINRRVHVRGVATLVWPGRLLCIQDGTQGLCAHTSQNDRVPAGDTVDLIGFPVIGDFTPTLVNATYRRFGGSQPVQATNITAQQALREDHDAGLVSIEGQLIGEDRDGENPTILLAAGPVVFAALLPGSSGPRLWRPLEKGSWLRVTGICLAQSDTTVPLGVGFREAKSFRILQRSTKDIVVLRRPSWWSPTHSLMVLALASFIAMVALGGIVILRNRVKEQTAVIRDQLMETIALKDAAEFQATHDGLTGLCNRNAIFQLLDREFDPALRTGLATGIIMLDLDHFKKINDTYGHAAGDKVLQEIAQRLVSAVRCSDLVGRYGGEEFLIVLPHCDAHQCLACAERVRMAVAGRPVMHEGIALHMTASLGTSLALSHVHTAHQALVAADSALYRAKRNGRNQVVSLDVRSPEPGRPQLAI